MTKGLRMPPWYDLGSGWRYSPFGALYRYRDGVVITAGQWKMTQIVIQRKLRFTQSRRWWRKVGKN